MIEVLKIKLMLAVFIGLALGCDMGEKKPNNKGPKDRANKPNLNDYRLLLSLPDNFDVGKETPFKLLVTLDGKVVDGLDGHIRSWSYRCDDHDKDDYKVGSDDTIILDSNGETELRFVIEPNPKGDGSWKNCRIVAIVEMKYGDDERTVTVESDVFVVNAETCSVDAPDVSNSGLSITTQPTNTKIGRKINLAVSGATTVRLDVAGADECHQGAKSLSLVRWGTDKVELLTSETDVSVDSLGQLYIVASNGINAVPEGVSGCKIRVRSQGACVTNSIETAAFDVAADPSNSMSHVSIEAYWSDAVTGAGGGGNGRPLLNAFIRGSKGTSGDTSKYSFAQNNQKSQGIRSFEDQFFAIDPKPAISNGIEAIKDMLFMLLDKDTDEVLLIKPRASSCGYVRSDQADERQAYRCNR